MHMLIKRHDGGHLYNPGGVGEREFDLTSLLLAGETVTDTRDLPGFVLGNTTYESHHFWVHFVGEQRAYIRVHHGGGWEVWEGDYMLAHALRRFGPDDIGLFLLCWYLIDTTRTARQVGADESALIYRKAFIDGRLRKRRLPARGQTKVWIEQPQAKALAQAAP
jgi:hypothetical protein